MKTMITALVAMAFSFNASASHLPSPVSCENCPEAMKAEKPVSKSYDQKVAELQQAAEDRISMLHFRQIMQSTLVTIEKQKLENAVENLEAENVYNRLMVTLLQSMEQQKTNDQLEDISAANHFEKAMAQALSNLAAR